jgi:phosphoenolpyruvate synthase/pyruvate phosphate dikinase
MLTYADWEMVFVNLGPSSGAQFTTCFTRSKVQILTQKGRSSGTGVLFSRNPSTGENQLYGEFLLNAQGEDVVSGIRTPSPIAFLEKVCMLTRMLTYDVVSVLF